jgi:hypothetical protein
VGVFGERAMTGQPIDRRRQCMIMIVRFLIDDSGASAVEYGLIAVAAGLGISAVLPILKNI